MVDYGCRSRIKSTGTFTKSAHDSLTILINSCSCLIHAVVTRQSNSTSKDGKVHREFNVARKKIIYVWTSGRNDSGSGIAPARKEPATLGSGCLKMWRLFVEDWFCKYAWWRSLLLHFDESLTFQGLATKLGAYVVILARCWGTTRHVLRSCFAQWKVVDDMLPALTTMFCCSQNSSVRWESNPHLLTEQECSAPLHHRCYLIEHNTYTS